MERLTYVTEKGEILFHPKDLPDDEGMTITQLAEDGRFKALEIIAESLANHEDAEEQGIYGKWIPVSERLPEESGSYLTWVRYDNEEFMSIEDIDCEGIFKKWNFTGKVLYWMPLPETYRESEGK